MTHPFDDRNEDSSVSAAVESVDPHSAERRRERRRVSHVSDASRVAVDRARYFRRKYAMERMLAAGLLFVSGPLILALIVLVRLTSKGPGIYRQKRVGLHGETFYVYKLRSMYSDAEKGGKPVWCTKGDRRITPLGKFLRKTHLDELPQLWNVVKGDMSLTGPRPERPEICEELAHLIDGYYHRNVIKPGVTGLAQINLEPDETVGDVRKKQFLDIHYIQTANLWLDVRMLVATCLRVCFIRGAVAMQMMSLCRRNLLQQNVLPEPGDERRLFASPQQQPASDDPIEQDIDAARNTPVKHPR
jgi:lipopolysaccharide/colanic/teichoic acid biosynthesis glycosyltransferase